MKANLRRRKQSQWFGWFWLWRNNLDDLESEYRRFLQTIKIDTSKATVPWSEALDEFWHEHMLDTKKYRQDCEAVFGKFIDHNPNLPKGTAAHTAAVKETKARRAAVTSAKVTSPTRKSSTATSYRSSPTFTPSSCSSGPDGSDLVAGIVLHSMLSDSGDTSSRNDCSHSSHASPSYDSGSSSSHDSGGSSSSCSSSSCSSSSCGSSCGGGGD